MKLMMLENKLSGNACTECANVTGIDISDISPCTKHYCWKAQG